MIKLEIVTSATLDPQPFLDSLALLGYPFMFDEDQTSSDLPKVMLAAEPFIKHYKLNLILWRKISRICGQDFHKGTEYVDELCDRIWELRSTFKNDQALTTDQFNFIKDWEIWWYKDSDAAKSRLIKGVNTQCSTKIKQFFIPKDNDITALADKQWEYVEQIQDLVKTATGKPCAKLKVSQAEKLKNEDPDKYKEYSVLRKKINDITKNIKADLAISSGGLVEVTKLILELNNLGVDHDLPDTFIGKIDSADNYYTIFDEQLRGKPSGDVVMNPAYTKGSSKYVCKYRSPFAKSLGFSNVYTLDAASESSKSKFNIVNKVLPSIDKVRAKWQKHLKSKNADLQELAVIVELLYQTQARIGTEGNTTKGESTYGISTLRRKHLNFKGKNLIIAYKGKGQGGKDALQKHLIEGNTPTNRLLIGILEDYYEETKDDEDAIFMLGGKPLNQFGKIINSYIRNNLGLPITAHKFRTIRGTELMKELLNNLELPKNPTESQIKNGLVKCAEQVGQILGHYTLSKGEIKINPMTSIKNYIDPNILVEYYSKHNIRPPRVIETMINQYNRSK